MSPEKSNNINIISKKLNSAWILKNGEISKSSPDQIDSNLPSFELPASARAIPTGFDLQTHLRFPGQPEKETLLGGLGAAFVGGYDGVCTMPNSNPFLDSPERLSAAVKEYEDWSDKPKVDVYFTGAATVGMQGDKAADIDGLVKAGAKAITDDGWGVRSESAMEDVFKKCCENNIPFLQHAETPGHGGVATKSQFQEQNGLPVYPRDAESDMIKRDLSILDKYPEARYHVLHVSTIESLQLIRTAKEKGQNVTAEVTPHHLFFSNADIPQGATSGYFKMNPPLFTPEDQKALQTALNEGLIDCVSTDHAPHAKQEKQLPWTKCPFGTRGLVTALPALLTLYSSGVLNWDRLIDSFSHRGRDILGISSKPKGVLFVDPDQEYQVTPERLVGISENSCFINQTLRGKIIGRLDSSGFSQF